MFDEGYEDLEDAFIRLPGERDSDDVLLLPSYQQYIDTIDTIIFGDRVSLHHHSNSHEDPAFMASTPNANPSKNRHQSCHYLLFISFVLILPLLNVINFHFHFIFSSSFLYFLSIDSLFTDIEF